MVKQNNQWALKLGSIEKFMFVMAWFAIVLPPGAQAMMTVFVLIWFLHKKPWTFSSFYQEEISLTASFFAWRYWRTSSLFFWWILGGIFFTGLSLAISHLASPEVEFSDFLDSLRLMGKLGIYGFFWIITFLFLGHSRVDFRQMAGCLTWLLAANFVYMLFQRYSGIDLIQGWGAVLPENRQYHEIFRASGLMAHPLAVGYNLMILTVLYYGLAFPKKINSAGTSRALKVGFFLALASLILTGSRWPLAVTLGTIFLFEYQRIIRMWHIACCLVVLIMAIAVLERGILYRIQEIFATDEKIEHVVPRVVFWKIHGKMFLDQPLFGVGYGQRKQAAVDYYDKMGYAEMRRKFSAHNIYLQVLADSGLVGFFGLMMTILGSWFTACRMGRTSGCNGLKMVVVAAILGGLMQNNFRDSEFLYGFWMCIAIFSCYNQTMMADKFTVGSARDSRRFAQ